MVCDSLTHDGTELLVLRRGLEAYAEARKTMGIPLLYPWANRLDHFGYEAAGKRVVFGEDDGRIGRDAQGLPIHGVLPRLLRWEAAGQREGSAIEARLDWNAADLLELFPYRHEVRLQIDVADGELVVATTVRATGEDPVPVSFGYHPYLRIPDVSRTTWDIALDASKRLVLDERGIPTGEREPVRKREFKLGQTSWDDGFDGVVAPAEFSVTGDEMKLTVTFRAGYAFAQVFAPAEQEFISFEPMTATSDALNSGDGLRVLAPGAEHRAEFAVTIASA
jgi:galactose mutarotase-like enzyme